MSMVDPKGAGPKIHGNSKVFELIERDRRLRQEMETKVWPAVPAELVKTVKPDLELEEASKTAPIPSIPWRIAS